MRQCEATTHVPPAGLLVAILAGQGRVLGSELAYTPPRVRCELGHGHDGEHADHVWDWDHKPTHALWAHWTTAQPLRFESLPWCEAIGGVDQDACTLYWDHVAPHAWDLHDPVTEALRRLVITEHDQKPD
ncbi:hypothetical protein ACFVT5_28320 [Streptomyces sp. NPDC058001]|uniref:hypothetical protein n=1 Tax=Streptomyces sp. NPDC058001 TaxID=3346300 RepID=UPI0036F060A7